jgi:hypothetical protein
MHLAFILMIILIVLYLHQDKLIEKFNAYQTFQSFVPASQSFVPVNGYKYPAYPLIDPAYSPYWYGYYIPWSNGYTDLPWWNTSLGNTTNMSYDIRGDPLAIPRTNFVWNNGTNFPIYNQPV